MEKKKTVKNEMADTKTTAICHFAISKVLIGKIEDLWQLPETRTIQIVAVTPYEERERERECERVIKSKEHKG